MLNLTHLAVQRKTAPHAITWKAIIISAGNRTITNYAVFTRFFAVSLTFLLTDTLNRQDHRVHCRLFCICQTMSVKAHSDIKIAVS